MSTELRAIAAAGPARPPALLIQDLPKGSPWRLSYHPRCGYTVGIWDDDGTLIDGGSHPDAQQAIDEATGTFWLRLIGCSAPPAPILAARPARTPPPLGRVWLDLAIGATTIAVLWLTVGRWLR